MNTKRFLVTAALSICAIGCEKEEAVPETPEVTEAKVEAVKKQVKRDIADSKDGPDCDTYVAEVQAACRDRYQKGLLIDCHKAMTTARVTLGSKSESAKKTMCAMQGKKLREEVAAAKTADAGPKCKALGTAIDNRCISKLGTPEYDGQCVGVLVSTGKSSSKLDEMMCGAQSTHFK